jgi:4-amino-4-deoxy-L-arabinose transferase-like glycosyltransferase
MDKAERAGIALLTGLALTILWWRWVGYQGGDDHYYADAALNWLNHFPALGQSHWALRYPMVLPIALSFALFGKSTFAIGLVSALYYGGFLILNYYFVRLWFGKGAAFICGLILLFVPIMPVQGTYADCDMAEMFFVMASFWLFLSGSRKALFISGVMAGLAFLTRETTLALIVFYFLVFVFKPMMPRSRYVILGLGFVAVVAAEAAYFTAMSGTPLYRQTISAQHDHVDRRHQLDITAHAGHLVDDEGVLSVNPYVDPALLLLVSQKFGLLFILAIPAAMAAKRTPARLAALLSLVWFLFIAINAEILYLVPRYFMVCAGAIAIPLAVGAESLMRTRPRLVLTTGAGFIASSLGLLYLENTRPLYSEDLLVDYVRSAPEMVYLDPKTHGRAAFLLDLAGLESRVSSAPPPAGSLVITKPGAVEACRENLHCPRREAMAPFEVQPDWAEQSRQDAPTRIAGPLLRLASFDRLIPSQIMRKIEHPNAGIIIYRTAR